MTKKIPKSVDAYIASAPQWSRQMLRTLRQTIRAAAPNAQESISYRMPYYSQNGRVAYFAAFKNHCSFFWVTNNDKKAFTKDLASHKIVGNTLQIPRGTKIPITLIKKIVKAHVKNIQHKSSAR